MKIAKIIAVVLLAVAMVGCSFDVDIKSTQDIEISYHAENEKNIKLVEELIYYDPGYIAFKIPALNENTAKGIELGYFIKDDGKPVYRVTYSLKNLILVGANISELEKEFEHFIPKLAAFHASKESLFVELEPIGMSWVKSFFSESASALWNESSTLLKEIVTQAQFSKISASFSTEFGKPLEILFIRAQYYEAFGGIPESVSLFYSAQFVAQKVLTIRIGMHQQNQKWLVMGFEISDG